MIDCCCATPPPPATAPPPDSRHLMRMDTPPRSTQTMITNDTTPPQTQSTNPHTCVSRPNRPPKTSTSHCAQARYAPEEGPSKLTVRNRKRSQKSWMAASAASGSWPLLAAEEGDAMVVVAGGRLWLSWGWVLGPGVSRLIGRGGGRCRRPACTHTTHTTRLAVSG